MEMVASHLAQGLVRTGHEVRLAAVGDTPLDKNLGSSPVERNFFSGKGYIDPASITKLKRWMGQNAIDVVHTHYSRDLWYLVPALKLGSHNNIPLVLTKHIGTMKPKCDPLHRWLYQRVDAVIAISRVIQRNILETHPVSPDKVVLLPNGVDTTRFFPDRSRRERARKELGIPPDIPVIGIAGRLAWWKGYREFLQMSRRILERYPHVRFLAVGGPTVGEEEEAEAIHKFASSLDLDHQVIFTGFQDDMPSMYSAMDLFVYPAYAEAFGLVLIEAMATGLPVVAAGCDGIPEIVEDGKTGKLVPARDTGGLTDAVMHLLTDRDLAGSYGEAGLSRVREHFDFMQNVKKTVTLYYNLIKKRRSL
jgi:glycosyltransferase involved in cell wall biosynthesis